MVCGLVQKPIGTDDPNQLLAVLFGSLSVRDIYEEDSSAVQMFQDLVRPEAVSARFEASLSLRDRAP